MKRLLSMLLIIVMLVGTIPTFALGEIISEYDPVVAILKGTNSDLEQDFREFVKQVSTMYFLGFSEGNNTATKYYYEAANLKHKFDLKNKDLPYNTQESISRGDFEQESEEVILYMLLEDMQYKALEIKEYSHEEMEQFFPAFDATSGNWGTNQQAFLQQMKNDTNLSKQVEQCVVNAQYTFVNAFLNVVDAFSGSSSPSKMRKVIEEAVKATHKEWIEIEFDNQLNAIHNAYRNTMIQEVMEAQKNLDNQMLDAIIQFRSEMEKNKSNWSEQDKLLYKTINKAITLVLDTQTQENVEALSCTNSLYGTNSIGETVNKIIDDTFGKAKKEMSVEELKAYKWVIGVRECLKAGIKCLIEGFDDSAKKELANVWADALGTTLTDALSEASINMFIDSLFHTFLNTEMRELDKDKNSEITETEIIDGIMSEVFKTEDIIWEQLWDTTKTLNKIDTFVTDKQANDALGEAKADLEMANKAKEEGWLGLDDKTYEEEIIEADRKYSEAKNTKEEWDEQKTQMGFIIAFVDNAISVIKDIPTMLDAAVSTGDTVDGEVYYSYISSAMYQAMLMAEKERKNMRDAYGHLKNHERIDTAPLAELKKFVDKAYLVLNTDLIGHAWYITLDEGYTMQVNRDLGYGWEVFWDWYFDRAMAMDEAIEGDGIQQAFGDAAFGLGTIMYMPLVGAITIGTYATNESEYLKYVQDFSTIGSWISSEDCMEKYDLLGSAVANARIPKKYAALF